MNKNPHLPKLTLSLFRILQLAEVDAVSWLVEFVRGHRADGDGVVVVVRPVDVAAEGVARGDEAAELGLVEVGEAVGGGIGGEDGLGLHGLGALAGVDLEKRSTVLKWSQEKNRKKHYLFSSG